MTISTAVKAMMQSMVALAKTFFLAIKEPISFKAAKAMILSLEVKVMI